jgi:hypothetical protein
MPQQMGWLANGVNDCRNVFELALDGIAIAIAALAATTPVHRIYGKVLLQRWQDGRPTRVRRCCAMNQHERRSCAATLVCDLRAVVRSYLLHILSFVSQVRLD